MKSTGDDFDYGQISHEQFEHALKEFVETLSPSAFLSIPGVAEAIQEEENNAILEIARQQIEEA